MMVDALDQGLSFGFQSMLSVNVALVKSLYLSETPFSHLWQRKGDLKGLWGSCHASQVEGGALPYFCV
jgi:hypothetical protein